MPSGARAGPSSNGIEGACRALEQALGSLGLGRAPGQTERCGQPTAAQAAQKSVEKQSRIAANRLFFYEIVVCAHRIDFFHHPKPYLTRAKPFAT